MTADNGFDSDRKKKMLADLPYITNMSKMDSEHKEIDFNF
jgi:hypothetical protein